MTHDVRPARYVRSLDAATHLLRRVMGDRARQITVRRVQGEHLERAESRKLAECAISVLHHLSYGYGRRFRRVVWSWKMRRNARSCTRRRQAGSAASQVMAKKCGALETYVKFQYLANHSASSREFHELPRTSRNSVIVHSSCFSSLGIFPADLVSSLGSFSSWARSEICAKPTGSVFSEWFAHGAHHRCAETRRDGAALRGTRYRLP